MLGLDKQCQRNYESQSTIPADSRAGDDYLDELISVMMTPKSTNRLHVPEVRIINAQVKHYNVMYSHLLFCSSAVCVQV